ncbi:TetR family transcriptional regulator [Hoyosella sp. YIM 151337]|uniref:TetR family transcriptional regulator n=1 Tax=Hoyosella sp. YIM 151337 TaxID=2992742 RepID=UPI002235458F|nr:TetR family transcriptional regulator [Hoyosella sp. YIM 151337]MCW4354537.1 TetR family transcriptional regulator [Hoyosella sp. YIM 151337]
MPEHNARITPIGAQIATVRRRAGISLRQLARQIGISPAALSAIENDKSRVTVARLHDIAEALATTAPAILQEQAGREVDSGSSRGVIPRARSRAWRQFAPLEFDPVLAGATSAFVRLGYHGATVRKIADAAGMSVPGVYHHYPSKQALLVTILDLTMEDLQWRVDAARAEAGVKPSDRFARIVEALALFHAERRDLAFIGASEMRSLHPPDLGRITQMRAYIQHLLEEEALTAIAAGEFWSRNPQNATRAISTMCTSLAQWYRSDGPMPAGQIAAQYAAYAVAIMRTP